MECGGGGNKADFQVSLAGPWADALCPPSCQQRKAALSSQAPPRPAGWRCSGVTVGTLDRVSSGRIWVSSGNWGTNTNPPRQIHTHGWAGPWRPCAPDGLAAAGSGPAGMDNGPLSAASSPLLSPGSGDESPALVLSPQGKGGNRFLQHLDFCRAAGGQRWNWA